MLYKNNINSDAFLDLSNSVTTIGSGNMSIAVDSEGGSFVQGPLSISSSFTNIRMGGIYKFNPMNFIGLPSTMVTPIPMLLIEPPIKEVGALLSISSMILSAI